MSRYVSLDPREGKTLADPPYLACPPLGADRYDRWFTDLAVWRPYVEWLVQRHGLPAPGLISVGIPGSHPVCMEQRFLAGVPITFRASFDGRPAWR